MDTVYIELARSEHIPLINRIESEAASIFPPGSLPPKIRYNTLPRETLLEGVTNNLLWIARSRHSQVLGYILVRHIEGITLLQQVDVKPQFMRRGIGKKLIRHAIDHLCRAQQDCLWLTTFKYFPWNAPFYEKLGFTVHRQEKSLPQPMQKILAQEKEYGLIDRVAMFYCPV